MSSLFVSRRKFLGLSGGVVAMAGGATAWAASRDPAEARLPWSSAGAAAADPRRRALSYAVLAPSPHNRQPWLADLRVEDEITLYCEADRRLPHTDPLDRQTTIGLGCFLELLVQAAAQDGIRAEIVLFPEGEPQPRLDKRPVARVAFVEDSSITPDPLFVHVRDRRSNKEAYDPARPVAEPGLRDIASVARSSTVAYTNDLLRVASLRALTWRAMVTEMETGSAWQESVDLLRIGRAEIEANPDGIALSGALVEAAAATGFLSRDALLDPKSSLFKQQFEILREPFDTAMAFMWLSTDGNSRRDQINAGRDYVRINLAATELGIAMHPLSQALQEYQAMAPHYAAIRNALGIEEEATLQMLVRLGYGPATAAAPRWPCETRIRSA